MLQELQVHNLALIEALRLDLSARESGLVVLTGETGAGKSIILQAVNLLTGGRGAASWVRADREQAGIEAVFTVRPEQAGVRRLLDEHGLAEDGLCIIRRTLSREGRSRMYVNDQSVTARFAAELTSGLINIASQHDHQELLNPRSHLDMLDDFGELREQRQDFARLFHRWREAAEALQALRDREQDKEQQRDFLAFQLDEIRRCNPAAGEDETLRRERDLLKASATLVRLLGESVRDLGGVLAPSLGEIRRNMEQAAELDPELAGTAERIASAGFELEDIQSVLHHYLDRLPRDSARLEWISGRLAELAQLQRKYGPTLEEVLAFAEQSEAALARLDDLDGEIRRAEAELAGLETEIRSAATVLTQARREAAARLETGMERELASLNFPQAVFRVAVDTPEDPCEGVQATGSDGVSFLFSANPGEPVKPLARIVSGGELSRLMLAMKCLLARRDQVDTVLFDEVDAGLGGQTAEAVAAKIGELAGHHQVLCITHLPQIAAWADVHFRVEKQVEDGQTRTVINLLNHKERVAELARMLGGEHPTAQTIAYAEELIARRGGGGQ